jgi:hypothetical protein
MRRLLSVAGTTGTEELASVAATFVVRLRRRCDVGPCPATLRLAGTEFSAPIRGDEQLAALLRAWLRDGAAPET